MPTPEPLVLDASGNSMIAENAIMSNHFEIVGRQLCICQVVRSDVRAIYIALFGRILVIIGFQSSQLLHLVRKISGYRIT